MILFFTKETHFGIPLGHSLVGGHGNVCVATTGCFKEFQFQKGKKQRKEEKMASFLCFPSFPKQIAFHLPISNPEAKVYKD